MIHKLEFHTIIHNKFHFWKLFRLFRGECENCSYPMKIDDHRSHDPTMIFHIHPISVMENIPRDFPGIGWIPWIGESHAKSFSHYNLYNLILEFVSSLVWLKKNSKPPMTGNGAPIPPWNGDDWGMVHGIAQLSLVAASTRPRTWDARSSRSRRAAPASRGFHLGATKGWNMANWKMMNNSPIDWHLNGGFQKWGTPESSI